MLFICGMAILLGVIVYLLLVKIGLAIQVVSGIILISSAPQVIPKLVYKMNKAELVTVEEDTQLFAIVEEHTERAGLSKVT